MWWIFDVMNIDFGVNIFLCFFVYFGWRNGYGFMIVWCGV